MTRRAPEAERIFRRALGRANSWGQVEITRGQLQACQRLTEFAATPVLSVKDRLYCDSGVVYLGSRMDDGVQVPPYLFYKFEYADLACTLQRFLALQESKGWQWSAVVPVDIISLPLALALATHLGVGTEPLPDGETLVVQALGETVEGLQDAAERLPNTRTFCLLACWSEQWQPDIVGLVTPLVGSLPWYRTGPVSQLHAVLFGEESTSPIREQVWQDPRSPEAIARDILEALWAAESEPTLPAQLDYYREHPCLRWL